MPTVTPSEGRVRVSEVPETMTPADALAFARALVEAAAAAEGDRLIDAQRRRRA